MGGTEIVVLLVLTGLYIWALVVCGMKGRRVLFVLGIIFGIFAIIGALLPPKPDSAWARKHAAPGFTA